MNKATSLWIKRISTILVLVGCLCLTGIAHAHEKAKQPQQAHTASVNRLVKAILSVRVWRDTYYSDADWQRLFRVAKLLQVSDPNLVSEAFAHFTGHQLYDGYDSSKALFLFSAMFDLPEKVRVPNNTHVRPFSRHPRTAYVEGGKYVNFAWPLTWQAGIPTGKKTEPRIICDNHGDEGFPYDSQSVYDNLSKHYKFRQLARYITSPESSYLQSKQTRTTSMTELVQAILSIRSWEETFYSEADWQRLFAVAKLLQNSDPRLVSKAIVIVGGDDLFGDYPRLMLLFSTMFDLPEKDPIAKPEPSNVSDYYKGLYSDGGKYYNLAWPITWQGTMPKIMSGNRGWSGQAYDGIGVYNDYRKRYKYRHLGRYLTKKPTVRKPYP